MADPRFCDELEIRDPETREHDLFAALPAQIAHAKSHAPHYARTLTAIEPRSVKSRSALAKLPVTRKSALIELQKDDPPLAGLNTAGKGDLARLFMSPGPIYEPEGRRSDFWRLKRALHAAGFRPGQLVHNCFSYHLTPAGAMLESAAFALGCAVVPGGTGQTELQLRAISDLKPDGYVGTPSFLKILIEKARETGVDISCLKHALVSGEAFPPGLQREIAASGIDAYQCYATAELGLIAYESHAREGLILDEQIIVELLRPGTGDPVNPGEVGEVAVTLFSKEYPLIRFATGDLSAILPGQSPCGRTNQRIKGWLGRADQTAKVKGLFVHPAQIAETVKRHPGLGRARLIINHDGKNDVMTLEAEVPSADPALAARLAESLTAVTKLKGEIRLVPPGSLPNDGKVIEDRRKPA
ncbi:MAG: AMP-binding protein [Stellaceae bacterium]|jgi:phenylacetate-CoA ligase